MFSSWLQNGLDFLVRLKCQVTKTDRIKKKIIEMKNILTQISESNY